MLYSRPTEIIITSVTLQQLFYKNASFHTHYVVLFLPCGSQAKLNWIIAPSSAHIPNNITMWNALLPRHCSRNCDIDCCHDNSELQLSWDQQLCTVICPRHHGWDHGKFHCPPRPADWPASLVRTARLLGYGAVNHASPLIGWSSSFSAGELWLCHRRQPDSPFEIRPQQYICTDVLMYMSI